LERKTLAAADADIAAEAEVAGSGYSCPKSLLVLLDPNPYLSPGSQQSVKTAAQLATSLSSKLVIAFIDKDGSTADFQTRASTVEFYMKGYDKDKHEVIELEMKEGDTGTTAIADMADDMEANLVMVGSDVVHKKLVDTNLLTEFIGCPFMVVPDA
jgi:K+-sensing histidine kinase KdpD